MVKTLRTQRLTEIDAIKGFLTLKMAASHFGFFLIPGLGLFTRASVFTFAIFAFCYAAGQAMSRRTKTWAPTGRLVAMYFVGGLLTYAFVVLGKDGRIDSVPHLVDRSLAVLSLQSAFPLVDLLLPFIAVSALAVPLQGWLNTLDRRRVGLFVAASVWLCALGWLLDRTGYVGPGDRLFASGFRTLQSLPIFAAGFLFGRWVSSGGRLAGLRRVSPAVAVPGFVAVFGAASWVASIHNKTLMWNVSGDPGYALAGVVVAVAAIVAMASLHGRLGWIEQAMVRVGQRAFRCLAIQMYGLPILATALLWVPSDAAKMAAGFAFIVGMAFIATGGIPKRTRAQACAEGEVAGASVLRPPLPPSVVTATSMLAHTGAAVQAPGRSA